MRNFTCLSLAIFTVFGSSLIAGPISKRTQNQIKTKIIPAYHQNDWVANEKVLTNWVTKFDATELDRIDEILDEQGVPSIGEIILDARVAELLSGASSAKSSPRELVRSMPVLYGRVEDVLEKIRATPFMSAELPSYQSVEDYHDVFWNIHVARNELTTAERSARYGLSILAETEKKKIRGLSDEELATLDIDFAKQASRVAEAINDLTEAKVEVQIMALDTATETMQSSKSYKDKLKAAYLIEFHADPVLQSLKKSTSGYKRIALQDKTLLSSVEDKVHYARESSGDLTKQARLLYLGMHWWMRGRYGQGPDGMGLLKSANVLKTVEAQFPLYMPTSTPEPTAPEMSNYSQAIPKYDRRHHYIWMYEYRRMLSNVVLQGNTEHDSETRTTSITKLNTFY